MSPPQDPVGGRSGGMLMPHSIDAEREVLSAVFIDPIGAMDVLMAELQPDDFYVERHTLVFEACKRIYESSGTVDFVTLRQNLKDNSTFEKAGGDQTLASLMDRAGTTANLRAYCRIVKSKALLRRMIDAARAIETDGLGDVTDLTSFLDAAEKRVFSVLEQRQNTNMRPMSDVVKAALTQIEAAFDADGAVTGVGTGFRDLDRKTHGLQKGDLVIIAARPAMGKTSFALNVATNAALLHEKSIALFSLEMPSEQLAQRMMAAQARIDLSRMRGGHLSDDDWPRLVTAADDLSRARIFIDDTPGVSPSTVRAMCRRLARRNGLDLVMIDYLQLMSGDQKNQSREGEISYISRSLKSLAKELSCPVIALSQLNRGPEQRTDKRPLMSDLRESGAIEQDADIIMFLYRDEVYNKAIEEDQRGVAELIIGKHRNGPTGTVKLKFWNAHTRFDNLAMQQEY